MGVKLGIVPRSARGTDYGAARQRLPYLVEGVSAPVYQMLVAGYVGIEITKMEEDL